MDFFEIRNWIQFFRGDTLIKLEKRDYELALINAESNVLNAKLNLEREKAESDLATAEWNRGRGWYWK